jgi:hypothetical protein
LLRAEHTEPADVVDRMLWRDAQRILARHAHPDGNGACARCAGAWPCSPRRLAERAEAASRRSWNEAWTVRHDLTGLRAMPAWRAELDPRGGGEPPHPPSNGGAFR